MESIKVSADDVCVTALSGRDHESLLDLGVAFLEAVDSGELLPWFTARLGECLDGDAAGFATIQLERGTGLASAGHPSATADRTLNRNASRLLLGHPLTRCYATSKDRRPLATADVRPDQEWRRSDAHEELVSMGMRYVLAIPVRASPGLLRTFAVSRAGMEFTERDRALAQCLQPLLAGVDSQLRELRRIERRHAGVPLLGPDAQAARCGITPRQLTVLTLLSEGLTAAAIARRLASRSERSTHTWSRSTGSSTPTTG
ncbi:hypothetical protein HII36_34920 [Nonomuraea sp. NN258]|uniref:hypothetical protein n=1 Tax=Nonomuraea antri TaxID=2730852 RepID=UPI0015689DE5|nr:hypothetical protein [Nonomuraea antri]NRQ36994.1 hypothetical protein [Nonomuraea antri]